MAARYLSKVAIGAIAGYLALSLTVAIFHPADVNAAAPGRASISAPTPNHDVVIHPQTFAFEQAPLISFSTITVSATRTGPAVLETAVLTVTEYVTVQAPLPTSITGLFEEYPYTATATFMGMTCFWITIIWSLLTFVMWCRLKLALRKEKLRKEEVKKLADLEKAPEDSITKIKEAESARNRHKVVSEMGLKQLTDEVGRRA